MKKQHRLIYQAIKEISQHHFGAVSLLLRNAGLSRQAYYKFLKRKETDWERQDQQLNNRVQYWFDFHHQGIGAGNILVNLEKDKLIDFPVTTKMVRRVMRKLRIKCQIRPKKHNRNKQNEQYIQDNLLNQNFEVNKPNAVWLADSTELSYGVNGEYKVRLSGVLDLYGRKLLTYTLSETETSKSQVQLFKQAFSMVSCVQPLIHTDRGSAYTSGAFNNFLNQFNIKRSMSRPGTPYDNAPMERWWNEFKLRWMERHETPKTYQELIKLVESGIEYFNHYDRSTKRNGLTPDEYWNETV